MPMRPKNLSQLLVKTMLFQDEEKLRVDGVFYVCRRAEVLPRSVPNFTR